MIPKFKKLTTSQTNNNFKLLVSFGDRLIYTSAYITEGVIKR